MCGPITYVADVISYNLDHSIGVKNQLTWKNFDVILKL